MVYWVYVHFQFIVSVFFFSFFSSCRCLAGRRLSDAMVNGVTFDHLTRKHGIKVNAGFPCSVEDIGLAVGEQVGHGSVRSAARMNSAVVIFLNQVEKVNRVVETGITVNQMFVQVVPLTQPSTRVTLSTLLHCPSIHNRRIS